MTRLAEIVSEITVASATPATLIRNTITKSRFSPILITPAASIAKANADRDVAIAQAQARKEANDAKVLSDTEIAVKQNELSIKKAELKTIEDTKNAEADAAYWQYLKVCEQVKAAGKYLEVVKELVRNLEDAYRTGMAAQNDLLKAQVKQNEAELMVQKAQNGLALSGMNLCRIVGVDLMSELTVRDSLGEGIVSGLWEEVDNITGRPEYNMLERQIELKEKEVALTRSDFLPQLGVSASYGYSDGITLNGKSDGIASFAALASLKIPIYHWGEGRNKVKAMKAEEEMVRLKKEETEQMMQLEVARARYNVEDAATRVRLTRRSLSQAEENLQVSKNRFEVGMETLTNYMEAQAQWQKAWSDWIEAKAELRVNETYYLKSTGRLSD